MKQMFIVIFTFLIAPGAGAEVVKVRLNPETYRIVLTGQDAQRLQASVGERSFKSDASSLESLSCHKTDGRCEMEFRSANVQSFELIQEQMRLADASGLTVPQMALPRNVSEQLLTANVDDSQLAEQLYALLPGPEVDFTIDQALNDQFSGKTKTIDLARNEFFMSCQQVARPNGSAKKGYSCLVNAIVPSGRE